MRTKFAFGHFGGAAIAVVALLVGTVNATETSTTNSTQQSVDLVLNLWQSAQSFQPTVAPETTEYSVTGMKTALVIAPLQEEVVIGGEEATPTPDNGGSAQSQPMPEADPANASPSDQPVGGMNQGAPVMGAQPMGGYPAGDCGCGAPMGYNPCGGYDSCGCGGAVPMGSGYPVPSYPTTPTVPSMPIVPSMPSTPIMDPGSSLVMPGGGIDLAPSMAAPAFVMPGEGSDLAPARAYSYEAPSYAPQRRRIFDHGGCGCLQRLRSGGGIFGNR